jgi:hypothetical protein
MSVPQQHQYNSFAMQKEMFTPKLALRKINHAASG